MRESVPLYHQLKARILEELESGRWKTGELLPSEPELARQFGVSRTTVRLAVGDLAAGGYIVRRQGRGTYVAERSTTTHASELYGFAEDLRMRHPDATVNVVRLEMGVCPPNVAKQLERDANAPVICIHRVALVNEQPVFLEKSYLTPPFHTGSVQLESLREQFDHIYGFFERNGVRVGLGTQSIRADIAQDEDESILHAVPGEPVLVIVRTTRDDTGSPIEHSQVRYRGTLYAYEVNLSRGTGMLHP